MAARFARTADDAPARRKTATAKKARDTRVKPRFLARAAAACNLHQI
jgi:hypothetical protein